MMANICLQTYLVSNLSALLTRADVGIYTMRSSACKHLVQRGEEPSKLFTFRSCINMI